MSTPAIARQSHALPPICHDSALGKVRIAETRQKPANRPETGKANRGWLTTKRAKVLGKIGADKFAASKRGKSILPRCVGCLLAIGWGYKRIVRHTGWAKTSVHRWAKFNGLNLRATAEQKKQAAMGQRKRDAVKRKAERKAETTLRLEKSDDGTTTIWCERGRHCYIAKADGHRFKWDAGAGMHLSIGTAREEKVAERTELLRRVALDVFTDPVGLKYGEAVEAIKITANCSLRCAENYHRDMKRTGILVAVGGGRWGLAGYAISPQAA